MNIFHKSLSISCDNLVLYMFIFNEKYSLFNIDVKYFF